MANKNEAKIKFTAETAEFNDAIKKSNAEMGKLRAEFKLNETQMKTTGASVEGLEKKHSLLEQQLKASESKTEALNNKIEAAARCFGENSEEVTKLKTQLANALTAEEKIRGAISDCNRELEEQRSAADEAESGLENLTDTIEQQQAELKQLKTEYVDAVLQYGKNSDEAKTLAKSIKSLSGELRDNKGEMSAAESAADRLDKSMDDAGDAARNSGDGFTVAKGAISDLISSAVQFGIEKISEFIGWLRELPEATRELRQDLTTLETSFDTAGFSTEQATNTWKELYKVFGEDDRAVEAANLIAKMSDNQKDLDKWVTITTGVWGQYQDSLPVEGLAEASMETARTGTVTGVLADALNWSSEAADMFAKYMGGDVVTAEDAFNVALSECSTEQERQALITETLTALYGDSAAKYEEAAGSQLAAKEATAENTLAQAEMANAIEPVTTAWEGLKTQLITAAIPAIEAVSGVMLDALNWLKEHPTVVNAIAAAVGVLAVGLGVLAAAWGIYTIAQWAANSAMLVPAIICVAIVAAIAAVVAIVVLLVQHWDLVKAKCSEVWESIKATLAGWGEWINTNVVQPVKNFFSGLWESVSTAATTAWDAIKAFFAGIPEWFNTTIIQPIINFFTGLWNGIVNIWNTICNAIQVAIMFIGSILSAAFQIITLPFMFIWENCKQYVFAAWEWIKNAVSTAINAVKNVITTVMTAISTTFTTIWNAIKNVFTSVWNAIVAFISPIVNTIKTAITNAWNAIKTTTTSIWNAVKSFITSVWNSIKSAVSAAINAVKSTVTSVFNAVKSTVSSIWNGIKSTIDNVWSGIKSGVTTAINSVKSTVTNVFNALKSSVSNTWNSIKNAISDAINGARDAVKNAIDKIKGFFDFEWSLPSLKLPHFTITGEFSLDPPSVPTIGIEWYKHGGVMMNPTIFGFNGNNAMVGGEAGPEAIAPISTLQSYISESVEKAMNSLNLQALAAAVEDLANRPIELYVGDRQIALATASANDSVNGLRSTFKSRGLIVD